MPPSPLTIVACAIFAASLLAAAAIDVRERRIPNGLVVALAAAAPAFHLSAHSGLGTLLVSATPALAILAAGLLQLRRGWIGAGDVKLAAAAALWLDPAGTALFLVRTALIGALLAVVVSVNCRLHAAPAASVRTGRVPSPRPTLPYGVAIAAGALLTFATTRLEWL